MTMDRGQWKSGSQCQGSDGGGKDMTRGVVGQRTEGADYEGRQGGGKSLVVMGRQRKDVAYQGRDQQRPLCIGSRYVN